MSFRLELIVLDERNEKGDIADVGFDLRTCTEEQGKTAVTMLRTVADKLETHMSLKKYGAAEPIEPEPVEDQDPAVTKTAAAEWTDDDADRLRDENAGDQAD